MTSTVSAPIIDMLSSSITTNKTDRFDGGVVTNGVDDRDTTVNNVEDTGRETLRIVNYVQTLIIV